MNAERLNDCISQGIMLMSVENYEAAKVEFEEAIRLDPKSQEAYQHLANAYANLEQYEEALAMFKNALILNPGSGEILFSIGNIYLLMDDKLKAIEYYNKAEEEGFKTVLLYQTLASVFYGANDVKQALRNITKAITIEPLNGELRLFKTRIYLADNRYDEALETLDELQKVLPDAFEGYDLKAQILCARGRYDEALAISEAGCKRFPDDANLAITKLKVLVEMEKDEEAFSFIKLMQEKGQDKDVIKDFSIQLSILHLRKQDVEKTLKILQEANESLHGDSDLIYLILDLYSKTGAYENILSTADQLIKMDPGIFYDSTAKYFKAYALDKLGRSEEAYGEYRKLTSYLRRITIDNPSFYEGYIYRLLSHTALKEYEQALELAEYIENLYPDRVDAHAFRYFIYKEQGDIEKSEIEKQKVHEIDPEKKL